MRATIPLCAALLAWASGVCADGGNLAVFSAGSFHTGVKMPALAPYAALNAKCMFGGKVRHHLIVDPLHPTGFGGTYTAAKTMEGGVGEALRLAASAAHAVEFGGKRTPRHASEGSASFALDRRTATLRVDWRGNWSAGAPTESTLAFSLAPRSTGVLRYLTLEGEYETHPGRPNWSMHIQLNVPIN